MAKTVVTAIVMVIVSVGYAQGLSRGGLIGRGLFRSPERMKFIEKYPAGTNEFGRTWYEQNAYEELLKGVSNVTGDYKVGALFDISYEGEIPEGTTVKVKLELNYGDYVAAGSYKDVAGNKWDNADCVYEDGYAVLTFKHFCPVAILVGSPIVSDVSKDSPQTGDSNSALVALGALVVCTAAAATVVLKKRSF